MGENDQADYSKGMTPSSIQEFGLCFPVSWYILDTVRINLIYVDEST